MNEEMQNEIFVSLPYAMHVHDIERIEETQYITDVNKRMREDGWVLLAIRQHADSNNAHGNAYPLYVLGVPRTQYCHKCKKAMKWNHKTKHWECTEKGSPDHRWR